MQLYSLLSHSWAIARKEIKELSRDPVTFAMIFFMPLVQIMLFSYAINNNPKHLPTAVISADNSEFTRKIIADMQNSKYFTILPGNNNAESAEHLFRRGQAQFALYIPPNFTKNLVLGNKPQMMLEADATDPAAVSYALATYAELGQIFLKSFKGSLDYLNTSQPSVDFVIHSKYNPNRITQYNIVPGLLSSVLSMTLVLVTALAIVRETELGTMEVLLTTPLKPVEILLGKIFPYIIVAYIQTFIILALAYFLFQIPIRGSITLLLLCCFPFILACLALGLLFSIRAKNQMQAAQATSLYFLPSILFSGFMFPYNGLPDWGKFIGQLLPSTHFLVIVRGIMLKGSTFVDILPNLLQIMAIFLVLLLMGILLFRQTLD